MAATRRVAWETLSAARPGFCSPRAVRLAVVQSRGAASSSSRLPGPSRPSRIHRRHVAPSQQHTASRPEGGNDDVQLHRSGSTPHGEVVEIGGKEVDREPQRLDDKRELSRTSDVETILNQDTLVVTRQMEMMNVFLGFEQANKYVLNSAQGETVGYLAETEKGALGGSIQRQILRTHRPFEAQVLDLNGNVVLIIRRSFTFINSKIKIYSVDAHSKEEILVGEAQQVFHLIRRKYDLYINTSNERDGDGKGEEVMEQFAEIDEGLWAWDFMLKNEEKRPLGAISRNFRGFGRELFTDTGQYVLTFDPTTLSSNLRIEGDSGTGKEASSSEEKKKASMNDTASGRELVTSGPARQLTMQERAVALATAVSADFDYFSRHSEGSTGGFLPWYWMTGGGQGGQPEAEGGNQGESGPPSEQRQDSTGVEAPPPTPGSDGGLGPAVGTGLGYDILSPGSQQSPSADSSSSPPPESDYGQGKEEVWGADDPWSKEQDDSMFGGGGTGGESGSSWGWTDFFDND